MNIHIIHGQWYALFSWYTYKMAASLECSFSYKEKEYLFVEETKKNLEALQCPVCFQIVLEPVQTHCGHLFCEKCVRGVTRCPACHKQFTSLPDHFHNRRVRSLRVKCPFTANGCKWVGNLGDVGDHEAVWCELKPKPCPYYDFAGRCKFQDNLQVPSYYKHVYLACTFFHACTTRTTRLSTFNHYCM